MEGDNGSWKKNLALIHRRHSPSKHHGVPCGGKENSKNSSHEKDASVDRDFDQDSLAFIDPALSIFGSSTPKYKMKAHDTPSSADSKRLTTSGRSSKWDSHISLSNQEDDAKKIIDYNSHKANEDQRDSVNMQTPTRNKKTASLSPPEQHDGDVAQDSSSNKVIRHLDFNSSVDGDSTFILAGNVASEQQAPVTPEGRLSMTGPKSDVSPESEVLRQSELKGELKSKIPTSVGSGETPGSRSQKPMSPTQSKMDSDFAHHLMATMHHSQDPETETSFVDALTLSAKEHNKQYGQIEQQSSISQNEPSTHDLPIMATPDTHKNKTAAIDSHSKPTMVAPSPAINQTPVAQRAQSRKIAEAALAENAALHDEWKVTMTPQGKKYFYNRRTRMSSWALPANAVFVNTGDNVQRIYVPRESVDTESPSNDGKKKSKGAPGGMDTVDSDQRTGHTSNDQNTKTRDTSEITTAFPTRRESSQPHVNRTDALAATANVLLTPPRASRHGQEDSGSVGASDVHSDRPHTSHSSHSSASSSTRQQQRKTASPNRCHSPNRQQIYSPVAGLTTPSRNEHPPVTHHTKSSNQTPSPGVAFNKRGSQSAGRLGGYGYHHSDDSNNQENDRHSESNQTGRLMPGPSHRFHTTTKLDTLREEGGGDDRSIGGGISLLGDDHHTSGDDGNEDGASEVMQQESRRLFLEESSVVSARSAHSDSASQHQHQQQYGESSLYCPLCAEALCSRSESHSDTLANHIERCIRGRESLYALEILDRGLQMVLARHGGASDAVSKNHGALPSSSVLTPLRGQRSRADSYSESSPSGGRRRGSESSHPETSSVVSAESPLVYHPAANTHPSDRPKTYSELYENRAILMADSSPSRTRRRNDDNASETSSSHVSATSSRTGRSSGQSTARRAQSAGTVRTPSSASASSSKATDSSRTPLSAVRNRSGIPRQPPSISPALEKQVADMQQQQSSRAQFVCPCCKTNSPKSREELLRHMRNCMGQLDGTDDEGSLSTAKTVPRMVQTSPASGHTRSDVFSGAAEGRSVCPFCGKPSSKSSLSAHLLGCKKRKESMERRHAPVLMSQSQKVPVGRSASATPSKREHQARVVDRLSRTASSPSSTRSGRSPGGTADQKGRGERSASAKRNAQPHQQQQHSRHVQVFRL